jgi:transposase-like protein
MTMSSREACPEWGARLFTTNGHIHNGKQNPHCTTCGRQFVVAATKREIDAEQRSVVERWRCEKISVHGICRVLGVRMRWLMDFMVARKTNHIERFNNTLRQRDSRLVRSTLAFSKKVDNHIGAIRYFICHYNLTRTALLV